ncbi:MAG: DUF2059 domain-containing protein [Acidobacteria bacterium]|nr:DUF2059 domain-containing protein [Acidobacteriota bacterium]
MRTLSILFILLLCVSGLLAQTTEPVAEKTTKQKLIEELIAVSGGASEFEKEFRSGMSDQRDDMIDGMVESLAGILVTLDEEGDSDAFRKTLREKATVTVDRMIDRIHKEIDYGKFAATFVSRHYEENYTEDELKEILTFYRTPTGEKSLKLATSLYKDLIRSVDVTLMPKVKEIAEEEGKKFAADILKDIDLDDDDGTDTV